MIAQYTENWTRNTYMQSFWEKIKYILCKYLHKFAEIMGKTVICKSHILYHTILDLTMAVLSSLLYSMDISITISSFQQQAKMCFLIRFNYSKVYMILSHKSNKMLRIQNGFNVWDNLWLLWKEQNSSPIQWIFTRAFYKAVWSFLDNTLGWAEADKQTFNRERQRLYRKEKERDVEGKAGVSFILTAVS